ncbi:MAG: putative manganese transporter, partial [Oscillospiraceae bacterium]
MYAAFFFMEYFEHKAGDKLSAFLRRAGKSSVGGTLVGAALGCVPQCGFSAAASNLYAGEMISAGTLIAVFVSTSDEALPILISDPDSAGLIWKLIAAKLIIAVIAGLATDAVCRLLKNHRRDEPFEDICTDCGCGSHGIWYAALKHTLSIALFILLVNLVLGSLFAAVGEDKVMDFLGGLGFVQPLIAAFVGMIPNCAASVIITELYVKGAITFGSAVAGLATGAGVGLAVLYRVNRSMKENIAVTAALYVIGAVSGIVINLFT